MTDIRTTLATAAAKAGLEAERFRPVGHSQWSSLLGDVLTRFTRGGAANRRRPWFWDDLQGDVVRVALQGADESLRLLPMVLPEREAAWFIAEDEGGLKEECAYWVFDTDTDAVVRVLAEHHLFEYYVVGRHLDWIVCENHHGVVMALGEPVARRLRARG